MEVPYYCTPSVQEDLAVSQTWYQTIVQFISVLCCLFAIPFTYWSCHCFEKGYVPKKLRILMYFHHIALLFYAISFVATQMYHLGSRVFFEDCQLLVPVKRCIYPRLLQSTPSSFFQLFYIAVVLNTFMSHYNFWNVNCARFTGWCTQFIGIDAVAFVAFSILAAWQRKNKGDPVLKYSISKKHRSRELERTTILIFPNILLNVICYAYFDVMSLYNASEEKLNGNNFLWANSVPIYVCLSPIIWMSALKRFQAKVNPQQSNEERYFNHLRESWDQFDSKNTKRSRENFKRRLNETSAEPSVSFSAVDPEHVVVHTIS
uniref:Serpentine Receptor, class T n=1 Tax=Caenorhabditis tropicalis TaxID=1561998 RepID=A0A1I7SXQ6_9PELO